MKLKNVEDMYPLSPMQELMLLHSLSAPESEVLFTQLSATLCGALDSAAYQRAWQSVVQRHPVLRTLFVWEGLPRMLQVVRQSVALPWQEYDWRHLAEAEQEQQLRALLLKDRARGFDLTQAPLLRFLLIRVADARAYFVWSSHHLLFDGWSRAQLLAEAESTYRALIAGQPLPTERPRPYREYIAWLQQQDRTAAERFWRHHLAGLPAPAPLGLLSGGEQATYRSLQYRLPASLGARVRALARLQHLTLNTVFLGAWLLLLSCAQRCNDLTCGTTVSGRCADLPGIEAMVGLFINTLPVRARLTPGISLLSLLQQLQMQQREMRLYEFLPLPAIQACADLPMHQRLFESLVVFENYPQDQAQEVPASGLEMRDVSGGALTGYPLTLVIESRETIVVEISYETGRFEAQTIVSLFAHLQMLLEAYTCDPQQAVEVLQARLVGQGVPVLTPVCAQEQIPGAHAAAPPAATPASPRPRDEVERELTALWEAVLGVHPIGVRENFFHLGGHSFLALHLLARVRQHFGQELPLSALLQGATVEEMALLLRRKQAAGAYSPLVALQVAQGERTRVPFFCVHPSGGNVLCYYDLARHLGADQPFYALEDPAIYEEQAGLVRIEEMAGLYLQQVRRVATHGPYLLGGWSFGGLVAFEMAQQLVQQGEQVALLALIDTRPPAISGQLAAGDDATRFAQFAQDEARRAGKPLRLARDEWQALGEQERLRFLLQEMKRAGLIGPEIGLRWVHRFLAQARAKTWAVQHYQPQRYPGRLTLLRTAEGIGADLERLPVALQEACCGPAYGWDHCCAQPVEVHTLAASHLSIVVEPFVRTLAAHLQGCLLRAMPQADLVGSHCERG
ncbi:MAG TPA: condensation domain-containing protein [Ktedonobacteraceae bacterium]|jgi:thioesterase domain-containing protein